MSRDLDVVQLTGTEVDYLYQERDAAIELRNLVLALRTDLAYAQARAERLVNELTMRPNVIEEGCYHCGSMDVNPKCPACNGIERDAP